MQKKSDDFSMQEALRLARSEAGQRLFATLQSQNGDAVTKAMSQASSGDYAAAKETLSTLLASPQVKAILDELGRQEHE